MILNFVIGSVLGALGFNESRAGDLGFLLVAYILGVFYANRIGHPMSKKLRSNVTGLFFVIYLFLTIIIVLATNSESMSFVIVAIVFASLVLIIESLVIYWFLGFGGKIHFKSRKKL